jgi:hypothetical protein
MLPLTYWRTLVGSISNPHYYRESLPKSWWFSLRFFLISMMIIGLVLSAAIIKINFPQYQSQLKDIVQELANNFPADLELKWEQNQLTSNYSAPILVNYPSTFQPPTEFPEKALIILPNHNDQSVPQDVPASSLMVANQSQLFLTDFKGNWSHIPLADLPGLEQPLTLNQQTLPQFQENMNLFIDSSLQTSRHILPIALPVVIVVTQFFDSLFYALIGFIGLRFFSKQHTFRRIWQISLHLCVIAFALSQLAAYLYPKNELPLYALTFWILFSLVSWNLNQKATSST